MSTPNFYIGGTYLRVSGSERNPSYQQVKLIAVDPDDGALLYGEVTGEDGELTVVSLERSELCYAISRDVLTNLLDLANAAPNDAYLDELRNLEVTSHVRFLPSANSNYSSPYSSRIGYLPLNNS